MRQSHLRCEIILIDDGSTDHSGAIADEYSQKDNRIKVIHQKNRGASVAHNMRLHMALGEYIAFFDSDDCIKEYALSDLYHKAIKHQADVVMGNIWLCHQGGNLDKQKSRIKKLVVRKYLQALL